MGPRRSRGCTPVCTYLRAGIRVLAPTCAYERRLALPADSGLRGEQVGARACMLGRVLKCGRSLASAHGRASALICPREALRGPSSHGTAEWYPSTLNHGLSTRRSTATYPRGRVGRGCPSVQNPRYSSATDAGTGTSFSPSLLHSNRGTDGLLRSRPCRTGA